MPEVEIRPAVVDELQLLGRLERSIQTTRVWQMDRSFRDSELQINFREMRLPRPAPITYPYPGDELLSRVKAYDGILVASVDNALVGYASLGKNITSSTAWVTELVVDEPMRRKSIATALLLAVQDWSSQLGLRRICLEMQSRNYPAICLASKLGYEFSGYNDQYYPNQDIALFFVRSSR
jgi:RimJ/RimL family protein N-acetyltransferase